MSNVLIRRRFLLSSAAGILLVGCRDADRVTQTAASAGPPSPPPAPPKQGGAPPGDPPMPYGPGPQARPASPSGDACAFTADNIEGPYYKAGAPERTNLVPPGMRGEALTLRGRVLAADCKTPIAGALVDLWQANADGHYDNDGSAGMDAHAFMLRGKVRTDASGAFTVQTIVPGRYLNGRQYRPAHIHVKLAAGGFAPLTTQLYFPGDPYNDVDPFIVRSLIMKVNAAQSGKVADYDFVLRQT